MHLSQRRYTGHLGENSAWIPRDNPEVYTEQETALIPSWQCTITATQLKINKLSSCYAACTLSISIFDNSNSPEPLGERVTMTVTS